MLPLLCLGLLAMAITLWQLWAPASVREPGLESSIGLRPGLLPHQRLTAQIDETDLPKCLRMYLDLTGRKLLPITNGILTQLDEKLNGRLSRWKWTTPAAQPDSGITYHGDGLLSAAETMARVEAALRRANWALIPVGKRYLRVQVAGPGLQPIGTVYTTNKVRTSDPLRSPR